MTRRLALLCTLGLTLAVALIPSAAAGGGCHPPPDLEMSTGTEPLVGIGRCAFIDTVVYVEPGDEVRWVNKDPVPHTVTGASNSWGTERYLEQGDDVTHEFATEGVYPYYCELHPSMVGAIVVGDGMDTAALLAAPGTEGGSPATGPSPWSVALAVAAAIGVMVVVARVATLRRRGPSATPVP